MDFTLAIVSIVAIAVLLLLSIALARSASKARETRELIARVTEESDRLLDALEAKHRGMLVDLHGGLTQQGDRLGGQLTQSSERVRSAVADELRETRDTVHALKLSLERSMGEYREAMLMRLG